MFGARLIIIFLLCSLIASLQRDLADIKVLLQEVNPDIVMLTGDIIDGRPFHDLEKLAFLPAFEKLTSVIHETGALWSFTPGNHDDDDSPWSRQDLVQVYSLPGCLSNGAQTFNHTLTVSRDETPSSTTALRLFLFDSGGNHPNSKLRYYTVADSAVAAYKYLSRTGALDIDGKAPLGTAWYHIPNNECNGLLPVAGVNALFDCALRTGLVPFPFMHQPFRCFLGLFALDRVVGSSKIPSKFFRAMAKIGNIQATFFGHDHFSDCTFFKSGIFMSYGRTGAHTPPVDWEGRLGPYPFARPSARICEFARGDANTKPSLETYIYETESPLKHLVVINDKTTAAYRHVVDKAEGARKCAVGFAVLTAVLMLITIGLVFYLFVFVFPQKSTAHVDL